MGFEPTMEPALTGLKVQPVVRFGYRSKIWLAGEDSNLRHPDSKSGALPLNYPPKLDARLGFEPNFPDSESGVLPNRRPGINLRRGLEKLLQARLAP